MHLILWCRFMKTLLFFSKAGYRVPAVLILMLYLEHCLFQLNLFCLYILIKTGPFSTENPINYIKFHIYIYIYTPIVVFANWACFHRHETGIRAALTEISAVTSSTVGFDKRMCSYPCSSCWTTLTCLSWLIY